MKQKNIIHNIHVLNDMKKQGKMEKVHNASLINQQITFFKIIHKLLSIIALDYFTTMVFK